MKTALLWLILLPFSGAFLLAVLGRLMPRRAAEALACASVSGSFLCALYAFTRAGDQTLTLTLFPWFSVEDFSASMSVLYDPLSSVMVLMVTFVSALIHFYSVGYMREDADYARYFCYLNLFVCAMAVIVLADNLAFLYLGWEGVGFCSYALIGFWYRDRVKAAAGRKAFVVTRIGDVCFGIAIAVAFLNFDSISVARINGGATGLDPATATVLGLLLLGAAVGKSAQLPLSVWLPDAMAGPTPVSALIHAATMVTAGVYLLMRLFPVLALSPTALTMIALAGALTAFYAACSALVQRDIKRVLAYSTISQVGYMFLGVGAGDVAGSMFHLLSHAFFKALLFLAAGCVIQALHEEHDIFKMGGLRRRLPAVYWTFLAGALALAALPPFGGFFSKDRILLSVFSHPSALYRLLGVVALATSFLTAVYVFRLFFLVFLLGRSAPDERTVLPVPARMTATLVPLALLSLASGLLNLPALYAGNEWLARHLEPLTRGTFRLDPSSHRLEMTLEAAGAALSLAGLLVAYFLYRPKPAREAGAEEPRMAGDSARAAGWRDFFFQGWRLDQLYERALVAPYRRLAQFSWQFLDEGTVDEGFDRTASLFSGMSSVLGLWTTGRLSFYLKMVLVGFAAILGLLVADWTFS